MRRENTTGRKPVLKKRRPGVALIVALVIVLVGSALISVIFSASGTFATLMVQQRRPYLNRVVATDYVERAKGYIVAENNLRETKKLPVLHGARMTGPESLIRSLDDLRLADAALNVNEAIRVHQGPQRVVMQVFDANYDPVNVDVANLSSADIRALPQSLLLVPPAQNDSGLTNTGVSHTQNKGGNADDALISQALFNTYGAYLIRVRLFDITASGDVPVRVVEEAFFQTIKN